MKAKCFGFFPRRTRSGEGMQAHLREFSDTVTTCNLEKLEHEPLTIQFTNESTAALLANQHMFSHQFIHCTPHGPDRHIKAPGKFGFIGQCQTGRSNAGLDVCN